MCLTVGILSDAHGNLAGFKACLDAMGHVDLLLFAGDLLGYYFESREILYKLWEQRAICIAGNHDLFFLTFLGLPVCDVLDVPSEVTYRDRYGPSLERAREELSAKEIEWLTSLTCQRRLTIAGRTVMLVHGSPFRPADGYVYPDHPRFDELHAVDANIVVMGHTHRPFIRAASNILINAGSCGQPRDGDIRASYAILDFDGSNVRVSIERVEYDRTTVLAQCASFAPENSLLPQLLTRKN
jgi:putative phosphoesterase